MSMNYSQIKKLDEDTQRNLQEGSGPVSECLCSLLAPPDDEPKGLRGSIKRAFASMGGRRGASGGAGGKRGRGGVAVVSSGGPNTVEIPLTFDKGGKGIYSTREAVKRKGSCGKCGCDNEKIFLKHSYANIRITSPDVSSVCPCPSSACMPDKEKFNNNISVTVERVELSDVDTDDGVTNLPGAKDQTSEKKNKPVRNRLERPSVKELVEHVWRDFKTEDRWSSDLEENATEDAKTLDSRPEYDVDTLNSYSFSRAMEEQHEDSLKRPYAE